MAVDIKQLVELSNNFFGTEFIAIKGYTKVLDFETKELSAYKLRVLVSWEDSPFYYENLEIKVKNLSPSVSIKSLENNKVTPVTLEGFAVSEYKGKIYFSATDVVSTPDTKIIVNK